MASMRPRHKAAEDASHLDDDYEDWFRFNEAAA